MKLSARILLLFFLSDLMAGTTGKISGIITDQDTGDKLIGVNVVIRESYLGAASDVDGFYFIPNIPPGNYSITASMIGYATVTISNVTVNIDKTTTIHLKMQPTVLEGQVIEIVAERPVVQKDNTSTIQFVDAEDLKIMPVNNFERLLSLSAGATTDFRGMHLRGGRVSETIYEIDGLPVQDMHFGYQGITVPSAAISEVSIMTGGFTAEYGNAQSGVVNIVTREGGELACWVCHDAGRVRAQHPTPARPATADHAASSANAAEENQAPDRVDRRREHYRHRRPVRRSHRRIPVCAGQPERVQARPRLP